jgi:cysteine desulfuration protein SufE
MLAAVTNSSAPHEAPTTDYGPLSPIGSAGTLRTIPPRMPGILQKQAALVDEFHGLDGWEARYQRIIARGRALPELPAELRTEDARVRGCSSSVWLVSESRDGVVLFRADSDALLVRGLIALLLETYSGHRPAEILGAPPAFIEELGLNQHLSPNRANGLAAMVQQIMAHAAAAQARG